MCGGGWLVGGLLGGCASLVGCFESRNAQRRQAQSGPLSECRGHAGKVAGVFRGGLGGIVQITYYATHHLWWRSATDTCTQSAAACMQGSCCLHQTAAAVWPCCSTCAASWQSLAHVHMLTRELQPGVAKGPAPCSVWCLAISTGRLD